MKIPIFIDKLLANEVLLARAEKAEMDARESLRLVRSMEARIHELESELHMEQMRVHDLKQDMEEGLDYLRVREQQLEIEKARAEKAEARVAELEKAREREAE